MDFFRYLELVIFRSNVATYLISMEGMLFELEEHIEFTYWNLWEAMVRIYQIYN